MPIIELLEFEIQKLKFAKYEHIITNYKKRIHYESSQ